MSIIDKKDNEKLKLRENLSEVVIKVNMISTFIPLIFLVLKLFQTGKEIKHFISKHLKRNKVGTINKKPNFHRLDSELSFQALNDNKKVHKDLQGGQNNNNSSLTRRSNFIPKRKIKRHFPSINYDESHIY